MKHINHQAIQWQSTAEYHHPLLDEVHIWRLDLDVAQQHWQSLQSILDEQELKRAQRFHFERHQRRFTVARAGVKQILARYLDCSVQDVHFTTNQYGKPTLSPATNLQFNVSHSHERALLAVTTATVGVDIEHLCDKERGDDIAQRFFSAAECQDYGEVAKPLRSQAFFHAWTRKEAFIKAIGMGLSFSLSDFDVSLKPEQDVKLLGVRHPQYLAADWHMLSFSPAADYMAALVLQQPINKICYFAYQG